MTILLGYARVSEWELRLLERSRSLADPPLRLSDQQARLRRACTALGVELHDEICSDQAPGGLDACWGLEGSDAVQRPGQARLRQLLEEHPNAAVALVSLDRLSTAVPEIDWLLRRASTAPGLIAFSEELSTLDPAALADAGDFLTGAAAERRARRATVPANARPDRHSMAGNPYFERGLTWERAAPGLRSRDSLEARRLAGLPHCRPSLSSNAALARRVGSMRDAGMTLQAIADTLNAERVPTIRGGAEWRRSSLQNLGPARGSDLDELFP
jgi:hypothetical protein